MTPKLWDGNRAVQFSADTHRVLLPFAEVTFWNKGVSEKACGFWDRAEITYRGHYPKFEVKVADVTDPRSLTEASVAVQDIVALMHEAYEAGGRARSEEFKKLIGA